MAQRGAHVQRMERGEARSLGMEVGPRIRQARVERGMSLAQLGGEDLSRSFLSLVELGKSRISLRALSIVAQRLELPISYFLEGSASADAATELFLDQAEIALTRRQPQEALNILCDLETPRPLRARFLWLEGCALMGSGRSREALDGLRESVTLATRCDDPRFRVQTRYTLGAALYGLGAFDESLIHLRHALAEAMEGLEDPVLMGKITVCIGHILYSRGDTNGAVEHYTRASELFGSLRDLNALGAIYSGLSLAYRRRGDNGNALRYSRLSLGAFEAQNNILQSARELNNLAERYLELGDLSEALRCARESIERSVGVGGRDVEALAHSTLAAVYLQSDDAADAEREAQIAIEMAHSDADLARIDGWVVLATLADREGDTSRADDLFLRALHAAGESEAHDRYADIALALSLALKRRGDIDRALEYALQAAQGRPSRSA